MKCSRWKKLINLLSLLIGTSNLSKYELLSMNIKNYGDKLIFLLDIYLTYIFICPLKLVTFIYDNIV